MLIDTFVQKGRATPKRNYTFYEPDPSNPKVAKARENRKTLTEFTVFEESLRIVEEALFYRVIEMMAQKRFNRNLEVKHDKYVLIHNFVIRFHRYSIYQFF